MAYRTLVVDDSAFMRKLITDFIQEDPHFEVIATARNGKDAIMKVRELSPDIITMDVEMPEMNGLEALRRIMAEKPTPVIMLSSLTVEGADVTIQALTNGAFDFVCKPSGSISLDLHKVKKDLLNKLNAGVKANLKKLPTAAAAAAERPAAVSKPVPPQVAAPPKMTEPPQPKGRQGFDHVVAIGTSTGGPRALQQVITRLPADFPAPVLIVQHMPPNFTKSLALRLNSVSAIRVVEAADGMELEPSTAYIAPGGFHMTIRREGRLQYRIRLNKDEPRGGHRPSVDTLFESLIPYRELKRHIVLMTGMGSDGAKGMVALRAAGAETTIAESEETCIVYGMPRAAVELNGVMHLLPQQLIPDKLIQAAASGSKTK